MSAPLAIVAALVAVFAVVVGVAIAVSLRPATKRAEVAYRQGFSEALSRCAALLDHDLAHKVSGQETFETLCQFRPHDRIEGEELNPFGTYTARRAERDAA